ncbi:MAG: ribosomal L7Ae/L30e/S12e/Gadd45 family protein [Clostridia bacterium]|nr:ribosomal L7Ae/L30e/S12e/Gadd45 family protein [Clostridia bacterium]
MDGDLKSQQILIGMNQSTEAVATGKVQKAYVAKDAAPHIREPFESLCTKHNVPITYYETKQQLGRACGIDVGATCVVVLL